MWYIIDAYLHNEVMLLFYFFGKINSLKKTAFLPRFSRTITQEINGSFNPVIL